jgi:hypothetical protein
VCKHERRREGLACPPRFFGGGCVIPDLRTRFIVQDQKTQVTIGRSLHDDEMSRVVNRILDTIPWYDPVENAILAEVKRDEFGKLK